MSTRRAEDAEVERLWTSLRKDLSRLGADLHTAEDVAQEAWLIATNNPPVERRSFRGWLRVVGTRLLWQSTGRERARVRLEFLASRERPSSTEHDPSAEAEVLARLRQYVYELPEPYHTALRMRFFEDREVEEIARLLAVSKWTVHTRIQRGIARLRTRMGAPAERRRSRGYFLVWLSGIRSRWASRSVIRARYAFGFGLVGLGLLVAWRDWGPRGRPALAASYETLASAEQPEALEPLEAPAMRISTAAEEDSRPARIFASRFAGTVRKPDGEPRAGAVVHSTALDGSRPETTTTSREDGRYEIEVSGDLLWASHAEWRDSTRCYLPSALEGEDLDLVLAPLRTAVEILVSTHEGVPVPDADILIDCGTKEELVQAPRGTLEYSSGPPGARTDAKGRASMRFPDVEIADLTVLAAGLPFWNEKVSWTDHLEIRLPRPLFLSGVCADEAGRPLFHARVQVLQHFGLFVRSAETDAEGRFLVDGLAPGAFVLRAEEENPGSGSARHEGALPSDTSQPLRLRLSEANSVFGRVVHGDLPVAGAKVSLGDHKPPPADRQVSTTITDAQGRFRFGGCRASSYSVVIFPPGSDQPCIGPNLRPGRVEACYSVLDESTRRAPIEVEFVGATGFMPRLVEFNRAYPPLSVVVVADPPGSGRFHSPPQPEGDYAVMGWNPDLGTWKLEVRHDPSAPFVHAFPTPEGGTFHAEVALPEGVRREAVELFVLGERFNRFGKGPMYWGGSRRFLPWNEEHGAFVGVLPVGTHVISLRGGGLAEDSSTIEIFPGTTQVTLAPHRGVEVTLVFQSNPPSLNGPGMPVVEVMDLELFTPTGVVRKSLSGLDHHLVADGFEFTVWIPTSTVELVAKSRPGSKKLAVARLREGSRLIEPGELEGAALRPRLLIQLHDLPGLENIKAPRR